MHILEAVGVVVTLASLVFSSELGEALRLARVRRTLSDQIDTHSAPIVDFTNAFIHRRIQ